MILFLIYIYLWMNFVYDIYLLTENCLAHLFTMFSIQLEIYLLKKNRLEDLLYPRPGPRSIIFMGLDLDQDPNFTLQI